MKLIFGFEPFRENKEDISRRLVKSINKKSIILPVIFNNKKIIDYIKKTKPEIIIGVGSCKKGKYLRIERKAKNIIKEDNKIKKIKNHPKEYFLNLKLKKIKGIRFSYNTGTYICNYITYSIMDYININKLKTKFAFIHVPQNFNLNKAIKIISILQNED